MTAPIKAWVVMSVGNKMIAAFPTREKARAFVCASAYTIQPCTITLPKPARRG